MTCNAAARGGHLAVLQWLREHDCPWDWGTCVGAARAGQLEVLQWAREHGCPWNTDVCLDAAQAGQLEVLQWMRKNGATGDVWDETRVRHIARKKEVLTWLDQLTGP
jgi:hypothetical protein